MDWTIIGAGFMLGVLGSMHCIGMCGPIALAIPHKGTTKFSIFSEGFIYNFGRVITYSIMGLILGLAGSSFKLGGFQEQLSLVVGTIILLGVIIPKKYYSRLNDTKKISFFVSRIKLKFQKLLKSKSLISLLFIGILNGLLPCGLVYIALAGSFAAGDIVTSTFYMTAFGFGTLPIMAAIFISKNLISLNIRQKINRLIPYGVALVAILMILRGLALDIPYISPVLPETVLSGEASCCH
jgi:hypothetical protein